jgi:hypothetical protein
MTEGRGEDPGAEPDDRPSPGPGAPGPGDEQSLGASASGYEPPWREARARIAGAWARGGPAARAVLAVAGILAAGLLGAFLFGLWHLVVGGFLNGNWRAGGFGIALASVAGVLLWIEASVARRLLPPARAGRA